MATHSSILAGRIPWREEPGGLQSWGLKESDMAEATWHTRTHFVLAALQSEVQNGLLCASYICREGEKETQLPRPMQLSIRMQHFYGCTD